MTPKEQELTPAQKRSQERIAQNESIFKENQTNADVARTREIAERKQREYDALALDYKIFNNYLRVEIARRDDYLVHVQDAKEKIQRYQAHLQGIIDKGYIIPTPPAPEPVVAHKVAPEPPAPLAPETLGEIQRQVNVQNQKKAAEERAKRFTVCPVCGEEILRTQMNLVHKKQSNRFMCVPSKDPRALLRAGIATTLEQAEAIYDEAGISPDTLRDIVESQVQTEKVRS